MKIGIFTDTYEPKIDGIVTSINSYKKELAALGHIVKIYSPKNSFFKDEVIAADNVRFPSVSYYAYPEFRISMPYDPRILNEIHKHKFDVIHTQTPGSLGLLGIFAARLFGVPAIHTYHTHLEMYAHYFPVPESIGKLGVKRYVRAYINRHDAVIAPSTAIKRALEKYGVSIPIDVLPTGSNLSDLRKHGDNKKVAIDTLSALGIPKDAKILVTTGRVGKEKNLTFLIDCFSKVAKHHPSLYYLIIGHGPYFEEIKKYAANSAYGDKIKFTGFLDHSAMMSIVAMSKLFLFGSKTDTQGLVVLEAMAVGKPVVALHASGVEDTLAGDNGGYLSRDSIAEFSEHIELLLKDSRLYQKKSLEAAVRAEDFSIEHCTKKLLAIYESIQKKV